MECCSLTWASERITSNGQQEYLDPSKTGSLTCPVYWMKRHLAQRRADGAKGGDYVFPAARGGKASPAVISSLLDMVVRGAPECRDLNAINAFSRYKCIRIDFVLYFDPFVENFRGGVFNDGRLFSNRDSDYGGLEVGCVFAISQNVGPRCKTGVNGNGIVNQVC